ncbi:MAG: MBL fold metallo-hydrolase [Thiotrichaceae bacterium]|nr:MBL fold metallo-hydrolase [Thiotrichaceae bacterium]
MIFKQLFEEVSCSYTYLLACSVTREAVLIDPVLDTFERDLNLLAELNLSLRYSLETHLHADHLTSASALKTRLGSKIAAPALEKLRCVDIGMREGEVLQIGSVLIHPLHTPGHTANHHAYMVDNGTQLMVFSGDALLIDGCGRTDLATGDAQSLYNSVWEKIFSLPDETLIYPGHDYEQRHVSSVAQEKQRNPRLGKSEAEFLEIMQNFKSPPPLQMAKAIPANLSCGKLGNENLKTAISI